MLPMHIMLLYDTMYKLICQTESQSLSVKSSWKSEIFQQLFFDQKSLPVDVTSGVVFNKSLVFRDISKFNLSELPNSYLGLNYMPIGQHQTSLVGYCYQALVSNTWDGCTDGCWTYTTGNTCIFTVITIMYSPSVYKTAYKYSSRM